MACAGGRVGRVAGQPPRLPWVEAGRWGGQRLVRPQAEAGVGQLFPREAEARVALAGGGEVGMGDDGGTRDVVARAQVVEQAKKAVDLSPAYGVTAGAV